MSNLRIVQIDKNGDLSNHVVKEFAEDTLHKKCGFKKPEHFGLQHEWTLDPVFKVRLYAKTSGKAGSENKYDFPPPMDNTLFFGTCCVVLIANTQPTSLTLERWGQIYEQLFGGFEDIRKPAAGEDSIDELEAVPASMKTKSGGYLKDDFVVSDTEETAAVVSSSESEFKEDGSDSQEDDDKAVGAAGNASGLFFDDEDDEDEDDDDDDDDDDGTAEDELTEEEYDYSRKR